LAPARHARLLGFARGGHRKHGDWALAEAVDGRSQRNGFIRTVFNVAWGFFLFGTLYTAILGIIGTPIYFVHFRSTRLAAWATSIYGAALLFSFWFVFIDPPGFIDWLMD
jgi:hypothetical protein